MKLSINQDRKRGIVWVCDLADSSKLLNDDETAGEIEIYLPRLYLLSTKLVEAYNGQFIKWTGDGFLAWFPCPLNRERIKIADYAFQAAWHLSYITNLCNLGISSAIPSILRHGITFEEDALILNVSNGEGCNSIDMIGRSVVLAFRYSGIKSDFPSIVTHKEISICKSGITSFAKKELTDDERKKYLKGEKFGSKSIYASIPVTISNGAMDKSNSEPPYPANPCLDSLIMLLKQENEDWCDQIVDICNNFLEEGLVNSIQKLRS